MSANEFNPHPFEGLIDVPKRSVSNGDRNRSWVPYDTGRPKRLVDAIPRSDADPHAMKRELRAMTKGELGPVSRLASAGVMSRTLTVLDDRVPTHGDGGIEYARGTGRVKKAIMSSVAALGIGAGVGLGLGIASDKLNNPDDNMPIPQMPYDGQDMMNDGMQPLHNEPSKATIPVSGEEHA